MRNGYHEHKHRAIRRDCAFHLDILCRSGDDGSDILHSGDNMNTQLVHRKVKAHANGNEIKIQLSSGSYVYLSVREAENLMMFLQYAINDAKKE